MTIAQPVKYPYPLPLVPSVLEQLRTAKYFTKLDLCSAYNLVGYRRGTLATGQYEYLLMLYGLSSAPSVFQCLINDVLRDMLGQFVIAYINDILVYSPTYKTHVNHVHQVLKKLLDHQLYIKGEKCEFHQCILFLGYVISPEGVSIDETKVVVEQWPTPYSVKKLQCFLIFTNFYRHIFWGFSYIALPLTSLLRGGPRRLKWNPDAAQAMSQLKAAFTTAPIIKHPDPS